MNMRLFRIITIPALFCVLAMSLPSTGADKSKGPESLPLEAAVSSAGVNQTSSGPEHPRAGETVDWQVIAGGGQTKGTAPNLRLSGTVGQTAVGGGSSQSYGLNHGFWQNFGAEYMCGDANSSGAIDIDDIVFLIAYVFQGGPSPEPPEAGDANCSGSIDIDDIVFLVAYVFQGGDEPCDLDGDGVPDC